MGRDLAKSRTQNRPFLQTIKIVTNSSHIINTLA